MGPACGRINFALQHGHQTGFHLYEVGAVWWKQTVPTTEHCISSISEWGYSLTQIKVTVL